MQQGADMNDAAVPLCVDLDGTLTPSNTLFESILNLCKLSPSSLLSAAGWFGRGVANFKHELARHSPVTASLLPFRTELVDWLRSEHDAGRRLVLATDADRTTAEDVARHLGFFDEVLCSDGAMNLAGDDKRLALVDRFGEKGFDYVGHSARDAVVWRSSRSGIVVGAARLEGRVRRICQVARVFRVRPGSLQLWAKAARLHQWIKNLLIFMPLLLAHKILDPTAAGASLRAFIAYGLCASSVYIVNDLFDLNSDRNHPRKRNRPFASGALSAQSGLVVAVLLLAGAVGVALTLNREFMAVLGIYYVLTWAYSVRLKRAALVDVMTLAGMYTLRIIAGSAATSIPLSFWTLAFSVFIFLSLGCVKRYTELDIRVAGAPAAGAHGRGYGREDLPLLLSLGTASGYCSIMVMALYLNSADSQLLYHDRKPLWLLCPLMLYWISRVWLLTVRAQMDDDPVVFTIRDGRSLLVLAAACILVLASI
jgi:4-hydroxybenzoate polyprenyltransferase